MCVNKHLMVMKPPVDQKNAWKIPSYIQDRWSNGDSAELLLKCGKCQECKLERGRNWTYKIFLEALSTPDKCFITLTYKSDKTNLKLNKKHLQDFIKRLRAFTKTKLKYFAAGEYGEKKGRAHYHIILLGYIPNDLRQTGTSKKGNALYYSKELTKLWGYGLTTVQRFDYKEVNYLTLYLDHNNENLLRHNRKAIFRKNMLIRDLKVKYKLLVPDKLDNGRVYYHKRKLVKDLTKEELSAYQKDYRKLMKTVRMKIPEEFNLYSLGLGFDNFIKLGYYKYELNIDNLTFEIPPEFIRKVLESDKYRDHEVYDYMVNEALARKKFSEEEYQFMFGNRLEQLELTNIGHSEELLNKLRNTETNSINDNFNRIKLNKIYYSDF